MGKGLFVRVGTQRGWIQGRNGLFDIRAVEASGYPEDNTLVMLDGIGKRGNPINGGIALEPRAMDELARKWLEARGLLPEVPENSYRLMRPKGDEYYAAATFTQGDLESATSGFARKLTPEEMEQVASEAQEIIVADGYWDALEHAVKNLGFEEEAQDGDEQRDE